MRIHISLHPKLCFLAAFGLAVFSLALSVGQISVAIAQEDGGVVPAGYQSGSSYNQKLGTALRFNYHTRGYGTQDDVFSIGGMKIFDFDGAAMYIDGQGTLSDDFGGGFNLGVGYRVLTKSTHPLMQIDPDRIIGLGFWTDGQSTSSDNFFTQLGFSFESLGESFDTRLNGYFPLSRTENSDPVQTGLGVPFFIGNNIFGATEAFTEDTAHTVVDSEFAKRIDDLEAWAFFGTYHVGGGGLDTTGYRAGVRGYAVPDLALSLQVTDDDTYDTNVIFGVTWFIGRTNKCNGPCGTIMDRFREPVMRNDFIAMTNRRVTQATGNALTDAISNDTIRVVHIDSNAGTGGDGSFENPFDQISDIDASNATNSLVGDILLVHSTSAFAGASGQANLQADQRLLGEGIDAGGNEIPHIVATNELGNINMPETAAGSLALARATIDGTGLDVLTLANGSSVNNFTINGANTAITATGISAPTGSMLANLLIDGRVNAVVNGLHLENTTGAVVVENTVEIIGSTGIGVEVFGGSEGVSIAAAISDSTGRSLSIHDRTGGTVDYTGVIDDEANVAGNFSTGVLFDSNVNSAINLTNTMNIRVQGADMAFEVTGNTSTDAATPSTVNSTGAVTLTSTGAGSRALNITGNDDTTGVRFTDLDATADDGVTVNVAGGGVVDIASASATRMIENTGAGNAFVSNGDATLTIGSNIENSSAGLAVVLSGRSANDATFNGTIDDTAEGLSINGNTGGSSIFTGQITTNTGANNGISIANSNAAAITSFGGGLDITTTTGTGFSAIGSGTLIATGTNTISTTTGQVLRIDGQTIDAAGATFDSVDSSGTVAGSAVELTDVSGGLLTVGSGATAGDGGTVTTSGAAPAILVDNVENLAMSNVIVDNDASTGGGIDVINNTTGTRTFAGMDVRTRDQVAIDVNNNSGGANTFNSITANTTTGAQDAMVVENNTGGTVTVNTATIDSAAGDGIRVENNANTTVDVNSFAVNTTSGTGLRVTGAGTVTTGGTSTIDSTTGVGINVTNAEEASISSVTVNSAAANAVVVTHNDGNESDVTLNNVTVTNDSGNGVSILSDGTAEFDLSITGINITTSGAGNDGLLYDLGANHIGQSDFTLTGSTIVAASGNALLATLDSGLGNVQFLFQDNANLAGNVGAGESAVDISVGSNITLNATIGNTEVSDPLLPESVPATVGDNNLFTNSGAGAAFRLVESNAGATVHLDLRDNTASGGTGFLLSQSLGTFNLVDGVDTIGNVNNTGAVTGVGVITPIAPPVTLPTP